ncbi:MAG TPA: hypothetical protein VFO84_03215 [Dehalococcoidia bacterium]|nr:hypothetical protein [Dehalococcoidia bacterium]
MATFGPDWFLCGGWAVDAWVGRQTRDHQDVDVTVFEEDQLSLFDYLSGWQLVAHDQRVAGDTSEPWDGRPLVLPAHIHARPDGAESPSRLSRPADQGFGLEILLNERSDGDWILSRGLQYVGVELSSRPQIAMPLAGCARLSAWGLPTVVPEVLLFYKATAYFDSKGLRPADEQDFTVLAPHLGKAQRSWLRAAVAQIYPNHPWLAQLG